METREFREFSVAVSDADVITRTDMGGRNAYAMVGHAFFSERFQIDLENYWRRKLMTLAH